MKMNLMRRLALVNDKLPNFNQALLLLTQTRSSKQIGNQYFKKLEILKCLNVTLSKLKKFSKSSNDKD